MDLPKSGHQKAAADEEEAEQLSTLLLFLKEVTSHKITSLGLLHNHMCLQ